MKINHLPYYDGEWYIKDLSIKAIQELKEKGFNNTQIADKLNMNVRSVRRILNSN